MDLADGLTQYEQKTQFAGWASQIEIHAENIHSLLREYGKAPSRAAMQEMRQFVVEIENWKAGCLEQRTGMVAQNSDEEIWDAVYGAVQATKDKDALLSIMRLKGFGSSRDSESGQRRAKVATSVLRFLWPDQWGVIDWRNAAMLGLLEKNAGDVEKAMAEARTHSAQDLRKTFDIIDENGALAYNLKYRELSKRHALTLTRAADIDMAIFGLSLEAWPMR